MVLPTFEWDPEKGAENLRKHGVSFEEAAFALADPFASERIDERFDYGEERTIAFVLGSGPLLTVVYTMRDDITRIISARKATPYEQKIYQRENASR